jgi:hypothetical protein
MLFFYKINISAPLKYGQLCVPKDKASSIERRSSTCKQHQDSGNPIHIKKQPVSFQLKTYTSTEKLTGKVTKYPVMYIRFITY